VLADFANPLVIGGDFPLLATEAWYRVDGWGDMRRNPDGGHSPSASFAVFIADDFG
jgi:hypothetical protein